MRKRKSGNCPSCHHFLKDSTAIAYHEKTYPKHKKLRFDGGNSSNDSASFENAAVYNSPTVNQDHQEIDANISAATVGDLPAAVAQDLSGDNNDGIVFDSPIVVQDHEYVECK
ncbi:hypothetical protein [Parasitella parasitica]|uniref:Uncharacterized protein n=1 Tax=Parasitella parasitica TaxID=35722 RepID=A0A0B7NE64_9FUNG|nr:hypothetical protein [Parasitella parasitica]